MTSYASYDSPVRRELREFFEEHVVQTNKKDQKHADWFSIMAAAICERHFTAQVTDNLVRLFIDGDFAGTDHTHHVT